MIHKVDDYSIRNGINYFSLSNKKDAGIMIKVFNTIFMFRYNKNTGKFLIGFV